MDFSTVKRWTIPEGDVYQVRDSEGNLLWEWKPYWNMSGWIYVENEAGTCDTKIRVDSPETEEWEIITSSSWIKFSHPTAQRTPSNTLSWSGTLDNISITYEENTDTETRNGLVFLRYLGTTISLGSFALNQAAGTGSSGGSTGGGSTEEPETPTQQLSIYPNDITMPYNTGATELSVITTDKWTYEVQYQGDGSDPGLNVDLGSGTYYGDQINGNGILSIYPVEQNNSDQDYHWTITITTAGGEYEVCNVVQECQRI